MIYEKAKPSAALSRYIDCYWLIDSQNDSSIYEQKIIPDGYPETIFHYKDKYQINIAGHWEDQPSQLLAGQIKNHFYLRNTGASGMVGIKWQPAAIQILFGENMGLLTDRVIALPTTLATCFTSELLNIVNYEPPELAFKKLDQLLTKVLSPLPTATLPIEQALELIVKTKGMISLGDIADHAALSERQLERQFKKCVGLGPKFYCRIVRFAYIFELMQQGNKSWSDLVYSSGFYDQSHFIKNFKAFTGEDPSAYGFDERNMANFHLKKR